MPLCVTDRPTRTREARPIPHGPKIATCCYCGTRAVLVLSGKDRHELSCSGCGAPLRELKMLRADKAAGAAPVPPRSPKPAKRKKTKRKKTLMTRVLDEAWDLVEDIFD